MNSRQILLVDDNPIQAATRRLILEKTGSTIRITCCGSEALDILADPAQADAIDLIITDHLMPGMNGPELVKEIRERGVSLPIIVLSGLAEAEQQYDDLDVTFRLKPFHPDSLIELVLFIFQGPMKRTA